MPAYTILIVDDDADFIKILGMVLRKLGYHTIFARDGVEATTRIQDQRPDLILLDFQMPTAGGDAVHKWLKNSVDTKATPVIVLSGFPIAEIKKAIPELPNVRFLSKPLDHGKLQALISELLQGGGIVPEGEIVLDLDREEPPSA